MKIYCQVAEGGCQGAFTLTFETGSDTGVLNSSPYRIPTTENRWQMRPKGSLKDVIARAESNGDYFMVGELIDSGFNRYMANGNVAGNNYQEFVQYIDDAYSVYINYMKLKGKILKA